MYLVADGGNCCGLKVIWGFGSNLKAIALAHKTGVEPFYDYDYSQSPAVGKPRTYGGDHGDRNQDPYEVDYPKETYEERFHRIIETLAKNSSYGLVQCVLIEGRANNESKWNGQDDQIGTSYFDNQRVWFPVVEKAGFKCVNRWYNSNSSNVIRCYQLVMNKEYYDARKKAQKQKKKKTAVAPFLAPAS